MQIAYEKEAARAQRLEWQLLALGHVPCAEEEEISGLIRKAVEDDSWGARGAGGAVAGEVITGNKRQRTD